MDDSGTGFATYDVQAGHVDAAAAVIQTNIAIANPPDAGLFGLPWTAMVSRTNAAGPSHLVMVWRKVDPAFTPPFPVQAQRYDMNTPPAAPTGLAQDQGPAVVTPDPAGTSYTVLPRQESFTTAAMTDPDAQTVRLQIEHVLNGAAYTGTVTAQSGFVASGSTATVTISAIANGQYKWRARVQDSAMAASAWVEFNAPNPPFDHEFNVPNIPPPAPSVGPTATTGQFRMDATTAIAVGGTTPEGTVVIRADIGADADGDNVRLEVEVQPVGTAFTGVATVTSAFGAAGNHQVSFAPVTSAAGYHWQAWSRDSSGAPVATSAPVAFGGNPDPGGVDFARDTSANTATSPAGPGQFESDGVTAIAVGATATGTSVILRATVTDTEGDQVAVQVEVKPVSATFDGTITATGAMVAPGGTSQVTFTAPPSFFAQAFHWRVRTIDALGATSGFVTFGGNSDVPPAATDFAIRATPLGGSENRNSCLGAAGRGGSLAGLALVLALAALAARRR
jgi:hypothetical protein